MVAGGRPTGTGQPLNTPPVLASNFRLPADRLYSRVDGTDTSDALEVLLGGLEDARALVFSSGMAAVATVLNGLKVGSKIVAPADPYHGVAGLLTEGEAQGRWSVSWLDQGDTESWVDAIATADLAWLETPENPMMTVADLPTICGAPRPAHSLVVVDSTFATPLLQKPLDLGADVVMHSATKFIGGHSDLLAGVLLTRNSELHDDLYHRRLLQGGTIGGLEAFLTIRGARTLSLRLAQAQAAAMELAVRLDGHDQIERVLYPGLPDHPTHGVAKSFMSGFGAILSFEPTGGAERATAMCERIELINHATSLGGVESTMERRGALAGQERIPPALIRLSVGCENVDDLWADLTHALG